MTEEHDETPTGEDREFLTKDEFDQLWNTARDATAKALPDLLVYPVLLLYTGFFFGPFMTVVVALVILRGRMHFRHAGIIFGVAGIAWLLIQGITAMYASIWSAFALQFARSTFNFIAGAATYGLIRSECVRRYSGSRATLVRTIGLLIILAILFFVVPTETAIKLGR